MLFNKILFISISCLALTRAFNLTADARPGLYMHSLDANGKEVTQYLGPAANDTNQPRDLLERRGSGSTPCGKTYCGESILDWQEFSEATQQVAAYCARGQDFYSAISFKTNVDNTSGGGIAYVCAYEGKKEGKNKCNYDEAVAYYNLIAANCGQYKAGYYMIEDWGLSYGYDRPDMCFCHC